MALSGRKKIIIGVVAALLVVIIVLVLSLFIPRTGEKRVDVWGVDSEFSIENVQSLEAGDEQFKILMFTDLQLWSNLGDNNETFDLMDELVARVQPDMIVLPGDNVSGLTTDILLKQLIKHMESYKIPWACTYGNHDAEGNATLSWQSDRYEEAEYCLFERGPSNLYGMGNYAVNITRNGNLDKTLFFLDNGRYYEYANGNDEIYMGYEQIAWYEWMVRGIAEANGGTVVPSMVFSHFAQPEFKEALEQYAVYHEADGSYTVPEAYGFGSCDYLPGCAPVKSGFFDKCRELGTTHMICGHDHENNAVITYEGVTMAYGMKTGPSPAPWNFAEETGGTLVTIHTEGSNAAASVEHVVL